MAANGVSHVFDPVMAAHSTMQSGASREQKEQAHQFLEQFQKSVGWTPPEAVAMASWLYGIMASWHVG